MTPTASRLLRLLEVFGFTAFVAWYIWQLQAAVWYSWIVFAIWLVVSFVLNQDTPQSLGWRADNLWAATKRSAIAFLPCAFVIFAAGILLASSQHFIHPTLVPKRFFSYMAFCLLQQVGLNSLVTNRLLSAMENPVRASFVAGTLFALLHWPNPVLVPLTWIGGMLMSWLFAKERNILPLTLWQGILGTLVWWAFPLAWHHAMRVGPGFYHFHP
jgi:hypothetical protein